MSLRGARRATKPRSVLISGRLLRTLAPGASAGDKRSQRHLRQEIASGKEHTCPGGWCQGERPRNDISCLGA